MDSVEFYKFLKGFFSTIFRSALFYVTLAVIIFIVVAIGIFIWDKITGKTYESDYTEEAKIEITEPYRSVFTETPVLFVS